MDPFPTLAPVISLVVSALAACDDGIPPLGDIRLRHSTPHLVAWSPADTPLSFATREATNQHALELVGTQGHVAVDNASSTDGHAENLAWSHTVDRGSNRALIVGVSIRKADNSVTEVAYGSAPLSLLGERNDEDGSVRVEMWYGVAPEPGTATVSVQLSKKANAVGGAVSLTGVDPAHPVRAFYSNGSSGSGTNSPSVDVETLDADLVVATVATEGHPGTMASPSAQAEQWNVFGGLGKGHVVGAGSATAGGDAVTVSWEKTNNARWAIGAVSVQPAPGTAAVVDGTEVRFWGVRGEQRSIQINYLLVDGTDYPFVRLDITDPIEVSGTGPIAVGDSVLITATVDLENLAVQLAPTGLKFGDRGVLQMWYTGASGDLNGDGAVDDVDLQIEEELLGLWHQTRVEDPWFAVPASHSIAEKWFRAEIRNFSNYAIAW